MATVAISPLYPIPNRPVNVTWNKDQPSANFMRVWATVAPSDSSIDTEIKNIKNTINRLEVYSGNGGLDFPWNYTFDKGGKYTFIVQEYQKGSGYGGGYENDPAGSELETKLGPEYTLYIYIGQRLTQIIGPAEHRANLNLWVWDSFVRATHKSIHGEDTPSITSESATAIVKSAIESSSVKTALANLVGETCISIIGDVDSTVQIFHAKWRNHVESDTYHENADLLNRVPLYLQGAGTPATLKDFVNYAITVQRYHFMDDSTLDITITPPSPTGPGVENFHLDYDQANLSLYSSVGSFDEAYGGLADLIRTYNLHRANTSFHVESDLDNDVSVISELLAVHIAYLTVIASPNPSTPPAQSFGAQILISGAGFKES